MILTPLLKKNILSKKETLNLTKISIENIGIRTDTIRSEKQKLWNINYSNS